MPWDAALAVAALTHVGSTGHWSIAAAIAAVFAAGFTGAYVVITWRLLRATKEQFKSERRAYVAVTVRSDLNASGQNVIVLRVENAGRLRAEGLKLQVDAMVPLRQRASRGDEVMQYINQVPLFTSGVPCLNAGEHHDLVLGQLVDYLGRRASKDAPAPIPETFTVTSTYTTLGTEVTEETRLDLDSLVGGAIPLDKQSFNSA